MTTLVNIIFKNAHNEEDVASITFKSRKRSSFNAMLPFFNKKEDKWTIGKQYGYLWAGDSFYFYYAGANAMEANNRANEAYEQACATLGLETV